jgi:NAD(P)-dependent dehydrogenase (short-subunit alcohol dehydrogenase family)
MGDAVVEKGAVLITGAGRGIGREIALRLAHLGYPLVLLSKTEAHLRETQALCAALVPSRVLVLDVTREEEIPILRECLADVPRLHAVVNNAGVGEWEDLETLSTAAWDWQIATNLRGPFWIIRETLPILKRQRCGLYVNIGSDCSLVGMPRRAAYNASKFGLVGLTVCLRTEGSAHGVHAAMVYLGKTDTYFRNHRPGSRSNALTGRDAAEPVAFVIDAYPRIVIEEISVFAPGEHLAGTRSLL